jgi:hypothetical protein
MGEFDEDNPPISEKLMRVPSLNHEMLVGFHFKHFNYNFTPVFYVFSKQKA